MSRIAQAAGAAARSRSAVRTRAVCRRSGPAAANPPRGRDGFPGCPRVADPPVGKPLLAGLDFGGVGHAVEPDAGGPHEQLPADGDRRGSATGRTGTRCRPAEPRRNVPRRSGRKSHWYSERDQPPTRAGAIPCVDAVPSTNPPGDKSPHGPGRRFSMRRRTGTTSPDGRGFVRTRPRGARRPRSSARAIPGHRSLREARSREGPGVDQETAGQGDGGRHPQAGEGCFIQ